jgi:hypothetical protein
MYIYQFLMKGSTDFTIKPVPTTHATLQAVLLGLVIPTISSILPI